MIYTITFNPSLDYVMKVADYREGRVNRSNEEMIFPGGKGINVSAVLGNLGKDNVALGFCAGRVGEMIEDMLKKDGIRSDFVYLRTGNSRINVKLKIGNETEINAVGPKISEEDLQALYKKLDVLKSGDFVVLAGAVPGGVSKTVYADIMERFMDVGVHFVIDATGELLTNTLKLRPFLVKPNKDELEEIFGESAKCVDDVVELAKRLREMGSLNVLVSLGEEGAVLVTEKGEVLTQKAPEGSVRNTTGAGDSMVAGFLAGYIGNGDYRRALMLGIAAGSATAFSEGLAEREMIIERYSKIKTDC